jgi:tRNA(Leu) C34 or U34 (ribose-2'-O)-methylase TrmL
VSSRLTLLGLDIGGEWNLPLLRNAAEISGSSLLFAQANGPSSGPGWTGDSLPSVGQSVPSHLAGESQAVREAASQATRPSCDDRLPHVDDLLTQFDHVIACEATKQSRAVYDYAAPRGHLVVIVGNELGGIPNRLLKKADQVVSIPMLGRGMSSVNVAVAAAIVLYALERDLGRKRLRPASLSHRDIDVLVVAPPDPNELGSLLRSAWAFGWRRVFLDDRNGVWFTTDRPTVLAGRAAARREVNPLVVAPCGQIDLQEYDRVVVCDGQQQGTPLSRFSLPGRGKVLLVYGDGSLPSDFTAAAERVHVDHAVSEARACFRHGGSILLSVVSHLLRRGRRG